MRNQINKLTVGHSTKAERKFLELLKAHRIKFRTKVKIKGREVDFIIGKYAIEFDSHSQDVDKNLMLLSEGLLPIHLSNKSFGNHLEEWLKIIKNNG